MAQNLQMVPEKRDYVVQNGSPVPSDRALEATYFALLIPENNYIYGTQGQGSLLYTLQGKKRTDSLEQQVASYATDAVNRQVIATGIADAVDVSNFEATKYGTNNIIKVHPTESIEQDEFSFIPLS